MTKRNRANLDVYGGDKSACIAVLTGIIPTLHVDDRGAPFLRFPRNADTEAAMQAFFDNANIPIKSACDTCRFLRNKITEAARSWGR